MRLSFFFRTFAGYFVENKLISTYRYEKPFREFRYYPAVARRIVFDDLLFRRPIQRAVGMQPRAGGSRYIVLHLLKQATGLSVNGGV